MERIVLRSTRIGRSVVGASNDVLAIGRVLVNLKAYLERRKLHLAGKDLGGERLIDRDAVGESGIAGRPRAARQGAPREQAPHALLMAAGVIHSVDRPRATVVYGARADPTQPIENEH